MSPNSLADYENLVMSSGLLERPTFESMQREYAQSTAAAQRSAHGFGEFLKSKGLLTAWQNSLLLKGRHKGFFLGKYKLLRQLGRGGMAGVYLAENPLLKRQDAVKVLPKVLAASVSSHLDRFRREAKALAKLDHKNIVRVYDIDEHEGLHFIVMEYIHGVDLEELVAANGPLSQDEAADYICQAAAGLHHAHERNLIHRDVKPQNLLLDKTNTIKLLDLGLAQMTDDQTSLTTLFSEQMLGTADYISPEQAINSHSVDARTDVYSLGCTFYFLLTGHPPFHEGTIAERLLGHQTKRPPAIHLERARLALPPVDPALEAICQRMMAKSPSERWPSGEVEQELRDWLKRDRDPLRAGFSRLPARPAATKENVIVSAAPAPPSLAALAEPPEPTVAENPFEFLPTGVSQAGTDTLRIPAARTGHTKKRRSSMPVKSTAIVIGVAAILLAGLGVIASFVMSSGPPDIPVVERRPRDNVAREPVVLPLVPPETVQPISSTQHAGEVRYYVVGSSKKYHRANCRFVTPAAREVPAAEVKAHYEPCKVCKPDQ